MAGEYTIKILRFRNNNLFFVEFFVLVYQPCLMSQRHFIVEIDMVSFKAYLTSTSAIFIFFISFTKIEFARYGE